MANRIPQVDIHKLNSEIYKIMYHNHTAFILLMQNW
jgi:hypothetical protein